MEPQTDAQLSFDFASSIASQEDRIISGNPTPLKLVYSTRIDNSIRRELVQREEIISDIVSYAKSLSW